MRRVLAFVILCLFGFLGCTVNSQGTGVGGSTGGAAGFDGGGGGSGNGGGCLPGPGQKLCGNNCQSTSDPQYGCANPNCTACTATHGTATCDSGKCGITCDQNYADCDHNPANGCEIDTQTNPYNCGGCAAAGGKNCFLDTTASNWDCVNGVCKPSKCDLGKADCQGTGTCETDLTTDTSNCGSCGHVCNLPNATAACQPVPNPKVGTPPGACVIGSCNSGYADCNNSPTDGCETDIQNGDPNNCGACGQTCNATNGVASCKNGSCTIACKTNWGNCDGIVTNGCETNLTNTTAHCGVCGVACTNAHGTTSCSGSKCQPVCANGYGDCDSILSNGCETNTNTDPNNCGACGHKCTGGETCQSGTCACPTGQVLNNGTCCTPKTCNGLGLNCGNVPDQCGGTLSCGSCNSPETCGGSGTPNVCGCTPTTCGNHCGSIPDGCGSNLSCGGCSSPDTCGGGGTPNVCGCTPTSCSAQGKNCGSISDGCNGTLNCGSCSSPDTCGGGGTPNVCGCTPTSCSAQGANCGSIPDGCGGTLSCGTCTAPQTCTSNVCGGCTPNCSGQTCGSGNDGCGSTCTACGGAGDCSCGANRACIGGACCSDLGQTCGSGSDCCSGYCGTGGASNNKCCRPLGHSCSTDADCCSNHCHSSTDHQCHSS